MDNAIRQYKARRQARLDFKAIERFKRRRLERLIYRLDADENDGNNESGERRGGHGNTRIPFGLCRREGITVGKDWTPEDAWNALEGKGYSADKVYKELKETGKVGTKTSKKPVKPITDQHFPDFMRSKALRKSAAAIAGLVSRVCDDGNITDLIGAAANGGGKVPSSVTCKRCGKSGSAAVTTKVNKDTREPVSCEIKVPMFSDKTNDADKEQHIRGFCHEWTHYLDMIGREGNEFSHFSSTVKPLHDAIFSDDGSVGEEARKLFDEFNAECDRIDKVRAQKILDYPKEVARQIYGDNWPVWINRTGYADAWTAVRLGKRMELHDYNLALKRRQAEIFETAADKRRRAMNGVSNLQGIYDAIYGGVDKDKRGIRFGHKKSYYDRDSTNRIGEALADYVALKATNPRLAAVFAKDKPKIAAELDKAIEALAKKLRRGSAV